MRALVLGGGSIKGAWQIGAVKAVVEKKFIPDIMSGISVGALNSTLITNHIGKQIKESGSIDLEDLALYVVNFWLDNIKKPEDVAIQRRIIPLLWSILRKKFNGASDTKPLKKLIQTEIKDDFLAASGINLQVGAVNMVDGRIIYAKPEYPDFLEYVLASSAIPFTMPVSRIGDQPYLDGGLRDSAPIGAAIKEGAEEIIVIGCHPQEVGSTAVNTGNVVELADKVMDIVSNNNLNNDIRKAELYNRMISSGYTGKETRNKKFVHMTVIRPDVPININVSDFDSNDIQDMIVSGYRTAVRILDDR